MLYIGIDLGTSAVKLLLMDEKERFIKQSAGSIRCISHVRDGHSRTPEDWFVQTMNGLLELTDGADKGSIRGISFGARCTASLSWMTGTVSSAPPSSGMTAERGGDGLPEPPDWSG